MTNKIKYETKKVFTNLQLNFEKNCNIILSHNFYIKYIDYASNGDVLFFIDLSEEQDEGMLINQHVLKKFVTTKTWNKIKKTWKIN